MKSRSKEIVFIDIETRPAPIRVLSWLELLEPFVLPPEFDPDKLIDQALAADAGEQIASRKWSKIAKSLGVRCGNIKDQDKIMEKVVQAGKAAAERDIHALDSYRLKEIENREEAFEKAALSPRTAEIFMIQWAVDDGPVHLWSHDDAGLFELRVWNADLPEIQAAGEGGEKELLTAFFATVLKVEPVQTLVNWTGSNDKSNFDWNMIQRRALALGLEVPWLQAPRVLRPKFLDLTPQFLEHDRWNSFCSLEKAAKELGIETDETPVTGQHCWQFFLGEMEADQSKRIPVEPREQKLMALNYAREDISLLRDIYYRMYSV